MNQNVLLLVRQLTPEVARRMVSSGVVTWRNPAPEAEGSGQIDAVTPDGVRSVIKIEVLSWDETDTGSRECELDLAFERELASFAAWPFNPWPQRFGYRFGKVFLREEGHARGRFAYRPFSIVTSSEWYKRHRKPVDLRSEPADHTLDGKRKVYYGRERNVDEILFDMHALHPERWMHPEQLLREYEDWTILISQLREDGPGLARNQSWSVGLTTIMNQVRPCAAFEGASTTTLDVVLDWARWLMKGIARKLAPLQTEECVLMTAESLRRMADSRAQLELTGRRWT